MGGRCRKEGTWVFPMAAFSCYMTENHKILKSNYPSIKKLNNQTNKIKWHIDLGKSNFKQGTLTMLWVWKYKLKANARERPELLSEKYTQIDTGEWEGIKTDRTWEGGMLERGFEICPETPRCFTGTELLVKVDSMQMEGLTRAKVVGWLWKWVWMI